MDTIQSVDFAERVESLLAEWHVPGLSISVFNQEDVSSSAFGYATLDPSVHATPDTLYDMASTSKSLTAAAIGKLISDDDKQLNPKIEWDTAISTLLREDFALPDPYDSQHATIEDILSHRTGQPGHDLASLSIKSPTPDTPQSVTRNLRNLPMTFPLRTKYQYNNLMYTVATHIIETQSKLPFSQFLQENIFDVLDMSSTYLQPSAIKIANQTHRLATRYVWHEDTQSYTALSPVEQPEAQGAGSLQSTVTDYSKWLRAMLRKDLALFPTEIYDDLVNPRIITDPEATESTLDPFTSHELYALGWTVRFYRGHRIIEHSGSISGFTSIILFMPAQDFGLVMLANSDGGYRVESILAMELIDQVLDIPVLDRVDWSARARQKEDDEESDDAIVARLRQEMCPGEADPEPLTLPLSSFTGTYTNTGYRSLTIDIQDSKLYIDGSDRSEPFTMFFEHVSGNTKFIATHIDDGDGPLRLIAEFRGSEEGKVEAVGISFCEEMEGRGELIWFEREGLVLSG